MINVSGEELPLRIATKQEMGSVHTLTNSTSTLTNSVRALANSASPMTAPTTNQIE